MTTAPNERNTLLLLARKYIWWLPPEVAVQSPTRVVAQVMNIGTWHDVALLEAVVPRVMLEDALRQAVPGWFSGRSWTLWQLRLGLAAPNAIPALPCRTFQ